MHQLKAGQRWISNDSSAEAKILAINDSQVHFVVTYRNITITTKSQTKVDDFRRRFPRNVK